MRIRVRIRVHTRIAAILLCLLLALTLAGCVHADRTITFNSDGTGTYTYAIGLSAQMISLGGSTLTQSMDKFGEQIKQDGGTYSRYDDSGYTYWKYVRPFTSVTQLDTFLGQSPQNELQFQHRLANADMRRLGECHRATGLLRHDISRDRADEPGGCQMRTSR